MGSAVWVVQMALVEALRADFGMSTLFGGPARVYSDRAPDDAPFPYIVIGDTSETDFRAFRQPGHEGAVTLHIWTARDDREYLVAIYSAMESRLNARTLNVGAFHVMYMGRLRLVAIAPDADGRALHGVAEYVPFTREV